MLFLKGYEEELNEELYERAKNAIGSFNSDYKDLAQNHDEYLMEDLEK